MLSIKKRKDHAEQVDSKQEDSTIDFAWHLYHGINNLGLTPEYIGHMRFGEFQDMFEAFKKDYNFKAKRMIFQEEKKKVSLLNI